MLHFLFGPIIGTQKLSLQAKTLTWWKAARLEQIKVFLQYERNAGRFRPTFAEGLD